ncbi:hypothetical protein ACOI22_11615 [Glaciecola sp. 2405UD65-10]|uniref:hypothetical protein n=1 Tax=Glaciecola sp. 2405UD65-10 TaxID=3397244 RepID=UPI003B592AB6
MKLLTRALPLACISAIFISGCMTPQTGPRTEQQKRMVRCDQYIDEQRDTCLRGEAVTIDDYKEDLKNYKKSKQKEALENQKVIPPKPETKPEEKPQTDGK